MQEITFHVKLKTKDLFRFTMRHTYVSVGGIFSILLSLGCLIFCLVNIRRLSVSTIGVLLVVAALFTVIQPVMLYVKCMAQVKKSKDIKDDLTYVLSEDGITVRQGEESANVKWYQIRKVVSARRGIYVYMSPVRAFIFPKDGCGQQFDDIGQMVSRMAKKYRDYIPEEEEEQAGEGEENGKPDIS